MFKVQAYQKSYKSCYKAAKMCKKITKKYYFNLTNINNAAKIEMDNVNIESIDRKKALGRNWSLLTRAANI